MNLIEFNPVAWFESAKGAGLERDAANAIISSMASTWITMAWTSGAAKWASFLGEGQALKDAATVAYLTLHALEVAGFLTLTVPKDLLDPTNLSRFQTEHK